MVREEHVVEVTPWLRTLAQKLGADDADDLVQETWLAAVRHPPDRRRPLRPWLAQVLRNALLMRRRTEVRRVRREGAVSLDVEPPAAGDAGERLERLEALIADLAEPFRGTIRLRYEDGLSAAEIARRQGVPAGTVRWRLKTGLDRLRAGLGADVVRDRRGTALLVVLLILSFALVWALGRADTSLTPRLGAADDGAARVAA